MSRDGENDITTDSIQDINLFAFLVLVICREINEYINSNNIDVEDQGIDELELLGGYFSYISTAVESLKKRESQICDSLSKLLSELFSQNNALTFTMDEVLPSFGYPFHFNRSILHWK